MIKNTRVLSTLSFLIFSLIVAIYEFYWSATPDQSILGVNESLVPVVAVVDGDTFKVDINGTIETVRLVGINTPESVDPRKPVECMGKEASDRLKTLIANTSVRLEKDPTQSNKDRYGRLLRFTFLPDGTDVGLLLIEEGYASESLYSKTPHKYRQQYLSAEQQAQQQQKGLWSPAICPN